MVIGQACQWPGPWNGATVVEKICSGKPHHPAGVGGTKRSRQDPFGDVACCNTVVLPVITVGETSFSSTTYISGPG